MPADMSVCEPRLRMMAVRFGVTPAGGWHDVEREVRASAFAEHDVPLDVQI